MKKQNAVDKDQNKDLLSVKRSNHQSITPKKQKSSKNKSKNSKTLISRESGVQSWRDDAHFQNTDEDGFNDIEIDVDIDQSSKNDNTTDEDELSDVDEGVDILIKNKKLAGLIDNDKKKKMYKNDRMENLKNVLKSE